MTKAPGSSATVVAHGSEVAGHGPDGAAHLQRSLHQIRMIVKAKFDAKLKVHHSLDSAGLAKLNSSELTVLEQAVRGGTGASPYVVRADGCSSLVRQVREETDAFMQSLEADQKVAAEHFWECQRADEMRQRTTDYVHYVQCNVHYVV
jgi:hypothetical protein